jgi:oligopeptide/dipeptide ABC transporter ATP-binding protein
MLLVAHDLALVSQVADDVVVLYAGVVAERGPARALLERPAHPYTRALVASIPPRRHRVRGQRRPKLAVIDGAVADLRAPKPGCRFQDRCPEVMDRCRVELPDLRPVPGNEAVAARCFAVEERGP